jgi:hypothetical protein
MSGWSDLQGGGGSGTVTSVALTADPASVFDVAGSPVTSAGTLALSMDNQDANTVLAGPASGAAAAPAFRAMVAADFPIQIAPQGRLTLTTGTPIITSGVTGATTVYYTPSNAGSFLSLYDGSSAWKLYQFDELSVSVPATTVTPFDIFVYDNAGSLALETVDWTNDTTRATAITRQNGMYVKSGTTTKLYLGTGRTTGVSGECEDSFGGTNTISKRFLWNMYNRVLRTMVIQDLTSHTYTTASFRIWRNEASNKSEFIVGVVENPIFAYINIRVSWATGNNAAIGSFGINSTAASSALGNALIQGANGMDIGGIATSRWLQDTLATGYNYIAALEFGGASSPTFATMFMSNAVWG